MSLLVGAVVLLLGAGASALALRRRPRLADRVYVTLLLAGAAAGLTEALLVLAGGAPPAVSLPAPSREARGPSGWTRSPPGSSCPSWGSGRVPGPSASAISAPNGAIDRWRARMRCSRCCWWG